MMYYTRKLKPLVNQTTIQLACFQLFRRYLRKLCFLKSMLSFRTNLTLFCVAAARFIDENKIFYNRQFRFRKNHSTRYNILCLTKTIRKNLDEGKFSCAVFLDLRKAFDPSKESRKLQFQRNI